MIRLTCLIRSMNLFFKYYNYDKRKTTKTVRKDKITVKSHSHYITNTRYCILTKYWDTLYIYTCIYFCVWKKIHNGIHNARLHSVEEHTMLQRGVCASKDVIIKEILPNGSTIDSAVLHHSMNDGLTICSVSACWYSTILSTWPEEVRHD